MQASAQLYIGPGSNLSVNSPNGEIAELTLIGLDLINNGSFEPGLSDVVFRKGPDNTGKAIGGNSVTSFDYLVVNMQDQDLTLQQDVHIQGRMIFASGECDLNARTVELVGSIIFGENETSSFIGPNGGEIVTTVNLNAPFGVTPGGLGVSISSSQDLGEVTIRRSHVPVASGGGVSIARTYTITPTNNSNLDAVVLLGYLEKELNGTLESDLSIWQKEGNEWINRGYSERDDLGNWVAQTGIESLSTFTLGDAQFTPVIELGPQTFLKVGDLFPNPAGATDHQVRIPVQSPRPADLQIQVLDPLGRVIRQQLASIDTGEQWLTLETGNWPAGPYLVRLMAGGHTTHLKLQKL
jgi:hypothetical protein